jgi:hypothetical protein
MSVLFDDDGKIWMISGNTAPYPIEELTPDLKSFVPGAKHQLVVPPGSPRGRGITPNAVIPERCARDDGARGARTELIHLTICR